MMTHGSIASPSIISITIHHLNIATVHNMTTHRCGPDHGRRGRNLHWGQTMGTLPGHYSAIPLRHSAMWG